MKNTEKIKNLLQLVSQNPDLPIVAMVSSEVVADYDSYNWWLGEFSSASVDSYVRIKYHTDDTFFTKSQQDEIEEYFAEEIFEENEELTEEEAEAKAHELAERLDWKKAIIVYIVPLAEF